MVSPINETVASVPQEGGKIAETVASAAQKETVTKKTLTEKDGSVIKEEKTIEKVVQSVKGKEEKNIVPPVDKVVPSLD